jgi:hypothetical protein
MGSMTVGFFLTWCAAADLISSVVRARMCQSQQNIYQGNGNVFPIFA